jgi:hypothetical protein
MKYNNADVHPNAGSDCRHIWFSLVVDGCYTGIFTKYRAVAAKRLSQAGCSPIIPR